MHREVLAKVDIIHSQLHHIIKFFTAMSDPEVPSQYPVEEDVFVGTPVMPVVGGETKVDDEGGPPGGPPERAFRQVDLSAGMSMFHVRLDASEPLGVVSPSVAAAGSKAETSDVIVWDRSETFAKPERVATRFVAKSWGEEVEPPTVVTKAIRRDNTMAVLLVDPLNLKEDVPPGSFMVLKGKGFYRIVVRVEVENTLSRGPPTKTVKLITGVIPPVQEADNCDKEIVEATRVALEWAKLQFSDREFTIKREVDCKFVGADALVVPEQCLSDLPIDGDVV